MKLIRNTGGDRVVDELRQSLTAGSRLDVATSTFSLFAFAELREKLGAVEAARLVLAPTEFDHLRLLGSDADRSFRNRLQTRALARACARWIHEKAEVRIAPQNAAQSSLLANHAQPEQRRAITGSCSFTTEGLGLTAGQRLSLIQCSENEAEFSLINGWFAELWNSLDRSDDAKHNLLESLQHFVENKTPASIYYFILYNLFKDLGEELDEDKIVKAATGIRDTTVWKKLFKFQRDGVIGAIDRLERIGGCIIADSVGLGKTFEGLAIIKYYELRNDRVLVLCPKRLRDNWTLYKANDRRNVLAGDRFNYDVLNHTDLSRDGGFSGDIDLANVNWGNYDLVVIDESHNFRNKSAVRDRETRYDRLMNRIIKAGVKTRVLMLSATPVNNRLADLKNQIAFVTEGTDDAFAGHGIPSIDVTTRQAQAQFNRWLDFDESARKPATLLEMLGFDYFKLLDLLTIARSRKHVEKYYGTGETGKFPERLKPINIKADVDVEGAFDSIREINNEIRRLNLGAYAPLRYVLPHKQKAYDEKYNTRVGEGESIFRQADREESLVHLLRVNVLKRMESSVISFALTLQRQFEDVNGLLAKIDGHDASIEEISIEDIEVDDAAFEPLLAGRKVKVLLQDVDRVRWRQDLTEDRDKLAALLDAAKRIVPQRDAKLEALRKLIADKCAQPINAGNRKILIFTAFADTANYLYNQLAGWAQHELGLNSALVTGTSGIKCNLPDVRLDMGSILTAFSPRSKERPAEFSAEGEIELLIATDCISEGQNLQDCDFLVNYDIHWNPVRIIQRFGRIDRIGSKNDSIQLVNFWPNLELEEYINLEQRVSGRMVLLDISATGEENVIEHQSGNQMNDLEYRRKQLEKLQNAVIDLEDLSSGISITDLTLNDYRIDLTGFLKENGEGLQRIPPGSFAVLEVDGDDPDAAAPGIIVCLQAAEEAGAKVEAGAAAGYPLAPNYMVHVGDDGAILLPYTQAKQLLDRLRKTCAGADYSDWRVCDRFDQETRGGFDMSRVQDLVAAAVASIAGKREEKAVASLFTPGGTHALKGEFLGINDFEVIAYIAILPFKAR